jgi:hypothetical protein
LPTGMQLSNRAAHNMQQHAFIAHSPWIPIDVLAQQYQSNKLLILRKGTIASYQTIYTVSAR